MWLYTLNMRLGPLVGLYWRLSLSGDVAAVPREGPLILAPNHSSFLDPWLVGMVFPRPVRFLMQRRWYDRSRLWNGLFRAYGTIPSEASGTATVSAVCRRLDAGDAVGVFPEGHISRTGKIQRFRPGLSLMAARSGAPVLPVGIRGGYESLPWNRRVPRPVRVTIHVGPPRVFPGGPRSEPPTPAESREFLREVFREVCALTRQRQDGKPAREPSGGTGPAGPVGVP